MRWVIKLRFWVVDARVKIRKPVFGIKRCRGGIIAFKAVKNVLFIVCDFGSWTAKLKYAYKVQLFDFDAKDLPEYRALVFIISLNQLFALLAPPDMTVSSSFEFAGVTDASWMIRWLNMNVDIWLVVWGIVPPRRLLEFKTGRLTTHWTMFSALNTLLCYTPSNSSN